MAVSSAPTVVSLRVIPVAGRDSMLLNLSGAHGPFFTRNLLILTDSAGHTGVGEVPGGEKIRQTLEDARALVVGQPIGDAPARAAARCSERFADRDAGGRGLQTFDLRTTIHAVTALEAALLDLLGQHLGVPVAALLGEGQQRDAVEMLGYLFYVGDRTQDRPALRAASRDADDDWFAPAPREGADARSGRAAGRSRARALRLQRLQAQGRRAARRRGSRGHHRAARALSAGARHARPERRLAAEGRDPPVRDMHGVVAYAEDPCGAEDGFSGREVMAEFRRATGLPTATNMIATDWRQMVHALALQSVDIPLADPHFWTMAGLGARRADLPRLGPDLGLALEQPLRRLAGDVHARRRRRAGQGHRDRHALDLAGRPAPDEGAAADRGRPGRRCRSKPGLGVELDMAEVEKAHELYKQHGLGARDDAVAMQYLIPDWTLRSEAALPGALSAADNRPSREPSTQPDADDETSTPCPPQHRPPRRRSGRGIVSPAGVRPRRDCACRRRPGRQADPHRRAVPAGGSSDIIARAISQPLSEALKQTVIVENKPGANGNTGTDLVAKSPADGHTLLLCDVGALAITPSVYKKLPFDPSKDLRGVTMLAYSPHLLVVHPSVPANNLKELVALSQDASSTSRSPRSAARRTWPAWRSRRRRRRSGSTSRTRAARRRSATRSPARRRC